MELSGEGCWYLKGDTSMEEIIVNIVNEMG